MSKLTKEQGDVKNVCPLLSVLQLLLLLLYPVNVLPNKLDANDSNSW